MHTSLSIQISMQDRHIALRKGFYRVHCASARQELSHPDEPDHDVCNDTFPAVNVGSQEHLRNHGVGPVCLVYFVAPVPVMLHPNRNKSGILGRIALPYSQLMVPGLVNSKWLSPIRSVLENQSDGFQWLHMIGLGW